MLYLPRHTYHRWQQICLTATSAKKREENWHSLGEAHTYHCEECLCPPYVPCGVGQLLSGSRILSEIEGRGVHVGHIGK